MIPCRGRSKEEKQEGTMTALEPMSDQGVLARFAHEEQALHWAEAVRCLAPPWLLDVVQAYTTVAVFRDRGGISMRELFCQLASVPPLTDDASPGRLHQVPCCYERGLDLGRVAERTGLAVDEVIRLHGSVDYTV